MADIPLSRTNSSLQSMEVNTRSRILICFHAVRSYVVVFVIGLLIGVCIDRHFCEVQHDSVMQSSMNANCKFIQRFKKSYPLEFFEAYNLTFTDKSNKPHLEAFQQGVNDYLQVVNEVNDLLSEYGEFIEITPLKLEFLHNFHVCINKVKELRKSLIPKKRRRSSLETTT